jgi:signal transduction histidine kinase
MPKLKFEIKITAIYLIIGSLWIIFSDRFVRQLTSDIYILSELQTYKGWFYVIITSILFYLLLKSHLKKLRKAEQDAKESDRLKTAFLQNISHEIRTPMNGIIGFTELLGSDNLSEEQKKDYIKIIINSSNQLLSIVDDVLAMSLLETGNINAFENNVSVNEMMDELYNLFNPLIGKNVVLRLNKGLSDNLSEIVTDKVKLMQIIYNLLNNANKFTAKGQINFGYNLKDKNLEFFVEDTGIGIDFEEHNTVFDRFIKSSKNTTKLYEGVGLGLAICKGNVEILGGKIWLKSELNSGSIFYFTIPYKTPSLNM